MTDSDHSEDYSAAVPLEVPVETAERAEAILRDFADDAELNMALIVDQSGMLIAGITADEDISTDIISALAAGANGAVQALAGEIGEESSVESIHQGESRCLYFRGLSDRFVLVGTADSDIPAGIIREKAAQIREELITILQDIREAPKPRKPRRKLHSMPRNEVPPPPLEDDFESEPVVLEPAEQEDQAPIELPPVLQETAPEPIEYADEELEALPEDDENEPIALPPLPTSEWEEEITVSEEDTVVSDDEEEEDLVEPEWEAAAIELEEEEIPAVDEESAAEESPEEESEDPPVQKSAPPVLVSPVVVDSPFEAIDDEDEEEAVEEEELQGSHHQHSDASKVPQPNVPPLPHSEESDEDSDEPGGEGRKPGPRYSFDLG